VSAVASPVLRGVLLGARLGLSRLRHRRAAGALLLATALVIAGAWIELAAGSLGAVDRALAGTFRLVIPLLSLALASRAASREGLGPGSYPLARFGVPRFAVALGVAASAALAASVAAGVLAALTAVLAHSPSAPPLFHDALMSGWIGMVTALAYAGWVVLGGTFWRGRGRWIPIVADYLLGAGAGLAGALLPRAHASSLLGLAPAPLALPPVASFGALFAMAALLLGAAALRSGR
jgi:hypothetical protein